jgi:hypothetical protein
VAEWQTRWLQVPVSFGTWGFKSPFAHRVISRESWVTHESRHWLQIPRLSAGVFVLVAPVVFVGVDVVAAEDVVAGFADDGDGVGGYQDEHWGVGVGAPDALLGQMPLQGQRAGVEVVGDEFLA